MRVLSLLLLVACTPRPEPVTPLPPPVIPEPPPRPTAPTHLAMGIPKGRPVTILDRKYFVLGFDPELHVARWAAWKLEKEDLGSVARSQGFHPDPAQPFVQDADYVRSGYDRGHLCPSADRTSTEEANKATFVLTNVHPQRHELNAGPWEDLEKKSRALAREGHVLYLIAGGIFDAAPPKIGRGVPVPVRSFKIVVVLEPGQDASAIRPNTPALAVTMPNDESAKQKSWEQYLTTIRSVEDATGFDFDPNVPTDVQESFDRQGWVEPPSARHVSSLD